MYRSWVVEVAEAVVEATVRPPATIPVVFRNDRRVRVSAVLDEESVVIVVVRVNLESVFLRWRLCCGGVIECRFVHF